MECPVITKAPEGYLGAVDEFTPSFRTYPLVPVSDQLVCAAAPKP
jgi:hypothetical protein